MLVLDWRKSFIAATASLGLLASCGTNLDSLEESLNQKSGEMEEVLGEYSEASPATEEFSFPERDEVDADAEEPWNPTPEETDDSSEDAPFESETEEGVDEETEEEMERETEEGIEEGTEEGMEGEIEEEMEGEIEEETEEEMEMEVFSQQSCDELFNVAAGKDTGFYGTFFTGGWGSAVTPKNPRPILTDYTYFSQSHEWDVETIWWSTEEPELIVDLQGEFLIETLIIQADDNDRYEVSYHIPGTPNNEWVLTYIVPAIGGWGMQTRAPHVLETSILADSLKVNALDGDGLYSVGELEALGTVACN